jgi:hypothetical protein
MIPDYFDCTICGRKDDPQSPLAECVICENAGCDTCLDEKGLCVPCA